MKSSLKKTFPSLPIILLSLLISAVGIGCGGGGGGTPPPPANEDASGIYNGTGSVTFTGINTGAAVSLTDVKGIISEGRFMFFDIGANTVKDPNANVLIDGQITSITQTDLVGTASIYQGGQLVSSGVAVTGTVTGRSNIQLSFASAAGVATSPAGDFTIGNISGTFDLDYDKGASLPRINSPDNWARITVDERNVFMLVPNMKTYAIGMQSSIPSEAYAISYRNNPSISLSTIRCAQIGSPLDIPNANANVYKIADYLLPRLNCDTLTQKTGFTGFASVLGETGNENTLWYAVTNGLYSIYTLVKRP